MGWCHEFGVEIEASCSHPMAAGDSCCSCPQCWTVCLGRFEGGCESVWQLAPRQGAPARPATYSATPALVRAATNGSGVEAEIEAYGNAIGAGLPGNRSAPADADMPDASDHSMLRQRLALVESTLTALTGRAERLAQVERALGALAEQVRGYHRGQASLEGHVSDLGKVLGQLGVEVDDRFANVEIMLAELEGLVVRRFRKEGERSEVGPDPSEVVTRRV